MTAKGWPLELPCCVGLFVGGAGLALKIVCAPSVWSCTETLRRGKASEILRPAAMADSAS